MVITTDEKINPESGFYGEKTILVAKTGYGKSYTARVIVEDGLEKGHSFIIIDPQDAYKNIPEFEYIESENVKSVKGLGMLLAKTNRNVVLSVKRLSIEDQEKFVAIFIKSYKQHIRKGIQTLIIDEIHKFAPEGQTTLSKNDIRGLFQESRSDGLGIIGITQRPQRLDKTCLAQAENFAVGRVTAFRDKESIKTYMDNPDDADKLSKLEKGEFFFFGFGYEEPIISKVREAKTDHSGDSPQNLLNEDKINYDRYSKNYVKVVKKKGDNQKMVDDKKDIVKDIVPSVSTFKEMAGMGMKMSLGAAVAGTAGTALGMYVKSPIPVISTRTLGAGATTVAMYAGHKMIPNEMAKDILKYGTAGSAAFTVGSLAFDIITATGFKVPNILNFAIATATGAQPVSIEKDSGVDLNTNFA